MERKCKKCGASLERRRPQTAFCGPRCKAKWHREQKQPAACAAPPAHPAPARSARDLLQDPEVRRAVADLLKKKEFCCPRCGRDLGLTLQQVAAG